MEMQNPTADEIAKALALVQAEVASRKPKPAPPDPLSTAVGPTSVFGLKAWGSNGPKSLWHGAKGQGKQKGPEGHVYGTAPTGKDGEWTAMDWGVPGFGEALYESLNDFLETEPGKTLDQFAVEVGMKIIRTAKKFNADERQNVRSSSTQAKVLIESFVEVCMQALALSFYTRPWFGKANMTGPLLASAMFTLANAKCFNRTLAPMLELFIQEGLFKWAEEERIDAGMDAAIVAAGVHHNFQKKAKRHLQTGFDDSHMMAPYGSTTAETTEMCMLQDFVKGWMADFISRAYDVMAHGVGQGDVGKPTSREEQVAFVTILFHHLTCPDNACLPADLTALIAEPPPNPWPFIAATVEGLFVEHEVEQAALKKARLNAPASGKGGGIVMGRGNGDWTHPGAWMIAHKNEKGGDKGADNGKGKIGDFGFDNGKGKAGDFAFDNGKGKAGDFVFDNGKGKAGDFVFDNGKGKVGDFAFDNGKGGDKGFEKGFEKGFVEKGFKGAFFP